MSTKKGTHHPSVPAQCGREETADPQALACVVMGAQSHGAEQFLSTLCSSQWRGIDKRRTHVLPIHIRAKVFGTHTAARLNADAEAEPLSQLLANRHRFSQVANRGSTALGEGFPLFG